MSTFTPGNLPAKSPPTYLFITLLDYTIGRFVEVSLVARAGR